MKKFFKWAGIVLSVVIVMVLGFVFLGKEETFKLDIQSVDLTQIPDGTYNGSYDCYRWSNEVNVTVMEHRITDIEAVKIQSGQESLVETLTKEILDKQSPDVDTVSGATISSKGYLKAVENTLSNAVSN